MIDYALPLDRLPDPLPIQPLDRPFHIGLMPPGSKSITCRAYVLAALANGESRITRPLRADDTDRLLDALCALGAEARWEGEDVRITGVAGRFPRGSDLHMGEGGTPTRFMIACACLAAEPVLIDASRRMRERPIAEGVEMLRQLGARVEYVEKEGRLPVRVIPSGSLRGGSLRINQSQSSQFVSAVILIGGCLAEGVELVVGPEVPSQTYLTLTMDVLREWARPQRQRLVRWSSSRVRVDGPHVRVEPGLPQANHRFFVDVDASSGAYWYAATLLHPGASCRLNGLGSDIWQPDFASIQAMAERSVAPDFGPQEILTHGPAGFRGFNLDAAEFPDGAVVLAALASRAQSASRITGLRTLRVKETDRIAALASELRKLECEVEVGDDWMGIEPSTQHDHPVVIETYNDHRMAMAFAVLGSRRPGLSIRNPACVAKSYPSFWSDFATLHGRAGTLQQEP